MQSISLYQRFQHLNKITENSKIHFNRLCGLDKKLMDVCELRGPYTMI